MIVKVGLVKPLKECQDFNGLIEKYKLVVVPLFEGSTTSFIVNNTDTANRRVIRDCPDVFDFIIDTENSRPI